MDAKNERDILPGLKEALEPLTASGLFRLEKLERSDDKPEIRAVITTDSGLSLLLRCFMQDWRFHLRIEHPTNAVDRSMSQALELDLGQVFRQLDLETPATWGWDTHDDDFLKSVSDLSETILLLWPILIRAFDVNHISGTVRKVETERIKEAVKPLIEDCQFKLVEMHFDDSLLRVTRVALTSEAGMEIRFLHESAKMKCKVRLPMASQETYDLAGLFDAAGVRGIQPEWSVDLPDLAHTVAGMFKSSWPSLERALHKDHISETIDKINNGVSYEDTILAAVRSALEPLTGTGIFHLDRLELHEEHQDNIIIALSTDAGITVIFIRDGWDGYCDLRFGWLPIVRPLEPNAGRALSLAWILESLAGEPRMPRTYNLHDKDADFLKMVAEQAQAILRHWPLLAMSFDNEHRDKSVRTVREYISRTSMAFILKDLTDDGLFTVSEIHYDPLAEVVTRVILDSDAGIELRFFYESEKAKCEIRFPKTSEETYELYDLLSVIGVKSVHSKRQDSLGFLAQVVADAVKSNWPSLNQALDKRHIHETISKIKTLQQFREAAGG